MTTATWDRRLTGALPAIRWGALLAAVTLVPVAFTTLAADPFALPKFVLLGTAVAVAGVASLLWWSVATPRVVAGPPAGRAVAALLLCTTAAVVASRAPAVSLLGQYRRLDGLVPLLLEVVVAVLVATSIRERRRRAEGLVLALAAGTLPAASYVFVQRAGADPFDWLDADGGPIDLPYGLLGNSNFSGAHLAIALPSLVAVARWATGWRRGLALAAAAGAAAALWATDSRGAYVAALAGVAAAAALLPGRVPRPVRLGLAALAAAAVLATLATAVTGSTAWAGPFEDAHVLRSSTLEQRTELWRGTVGVIADHPLLGAGPDTLLDAFPPHRTAEGAAIAAYNVDAAHDVLLHRAAGAGIPAALAYVVVLAAAARAIARRRHDDDVALAALAGGLAAYLVQGLVSIDVLPLAFLGWVLLGAVGGRTAAPPPERQAVRPLPLAATVAGGLVALGGATAATLPLLADIRFRDAIEAGNRGADPIAVAARLADAADDQPFEATYRTRYAQQLEVASVGRPPAEAVALLEEAVDEHERALDVAPGRIDALRAWSAAELRLARAGGDAAAAERAVAVARVAHERDPLNHTTATSLAAALLGLVALSGDAGARAEAVDLLAVATASAQGASDPMAWALLAVALAGEGERAQATDAARTAAELADGDPRVDALLAAIEGG